MDRYVDGHRNSMKESAKGRFFENPDIVTQGLISQHHIAKGYNTHLELISAKLFSKGVLGLTFVKFTRG